MAWQFAFGINWPLVKLNSFVRFFGGNQWPPKTISKSTDLWVVLVRPTWQILVLAINALILCNIKKKVQTFCGHWGQRRLQDQKSKILIRITLLAEIKFQIQIPTFLPCNIFWPKQPWKGSTDFFLKITSNQSIYCKDWNNLWFCFGVLIWT